MDDAAPPPCFGVMCQQHGECQHYHAVNGSQPGSQAGTCKEGEEYPRFLMVEIKENLK